MTIKAADSIDANPDGSALLKTTDVAESLPTTPPVLDVIVLVVCYQGRRYLEECLTSVLDSQETAVRRHVIVVDNASTDGSAEYLAASWPQIETIRCNRNLGFSGGNNRGWKHVERQFPQASYLCLLNQDTVVADGWLASLVEYLERNPHVGIVQPKILLHPDTDAEPDTINTVGTRSHFLGFGLMAGYGEPDDGRHSTPGPIDCASGSALLVRTELLRQAGLFNAAMFMYLEDVELCWKVRQIGSQVHYVPDAVVYHKYVPDAPLRHYEHLERNRWILLLTYYKWQTLLLLAPALLVMEFGQILFAWQHRRLAARGRVYRYFCRRRTWGEIMQQRRLALGRRTCSDRDFLGAFSGRLDSPMLRSPLLRWFGNPLLSLYWAVVRRLIAW